MEVAGSAFPITPLLSTCTKIVTILSNVGKKFKRAPLMMTSVSAECSLIHVALAQLRSFDWVAIAAQHDGGQEQLTRATESIILGCTLTLSVIEEYAVELQEYVEGAPISPTEQMGIMARVRVLWKEDEMRELLLQLRGYQTGLTALIRAVHESVRLIILENTNLTKDSSNFSDDSEALASTSNCTTLLQRSRSSRARKPLSIRAAMQQAATYTSISRPVGSSMHSSQPSTTSMLSRSASNTSNSRVRDAEGWSPIVVDSYDSGGHTLATRKGWSSDSVRRKRPAFLTLTSEDSDTIVVGQTLHTKKSKDQMRKSSPTVGERFRFTPGEPPVPALPPIEQPLKSAPPALGLRNSIVDLDDQVEATKKASKESLHDPPSTRPPQGPLPEPPTAVAPSPSPSRSRSPAPKSPVKSILRNGSNTELSSSFASHRRHGSSSPPKHFPVQVPESGALPIIDAEPRRVRHSPSLSTERTLWTSHSYSSLQNPRKQRSNSSVRDQIIMLPETARLRKQASGDLLRQQSSIELLGQTGLHDAVPSMPSPQVDRYVVGNAFGRRGSNAQSSGQVSRSPSYDMLNDAARKRSVADLVHHASIQEEEKAQGWEQQNRAAHVRSGSDSRKPAHLRYLDVHVAPEEGHSPTSDAVTTPSTIPTPTSQPPIVSPGSWPLMPTHDSPGETSPTRSHHYHRHRPSTERAQPRSPVQPQRPISPEAPPRGSRSITPTAGTGWRSRSNTLLTIESEATETGKHVLGDVQSIHGSVAPSIMSAQWHQSPQERLHIGPRVSHTDDVPWDLSDDRQESPDQHMDMQPQPQPRKPRVGGRFGGVPNRTSSRVHSIAQPQSPPRSPLLTDGFLTNVKSGLPKDGANAPSQPLPLDAHTHPSTNPKSFFEGETTDAHGKKLKKDKKKKESTRPSMKEIWDSYKDTSSAWYVGPYKRAAAEDQRAAFHARDVRPSLDVPSTTSRSPRVLSPQSSIDRSFSMSSASANSGRHAEKEKKKKKSGFMKNMFAGANTWYGHVY